MRYMKFLQTKYAFIISVIIYIILPLDFRIDHYNIILADFGATALLVTLIASAIVGAGASVYSGMEQGRIAKYNATLNERMAEQKRLEAEYAANRQEQQNEQLRARQRLAFNVAGVTPEGSPTNLLLDTAQKMELDALAIRYGGESAGTALETQAQINRMQGRTAQTAGYLGATSSLLSGATNLAKAYRPSSGSGGGGTVK